MPEENLNFAYDDDGEKYEIDGVTVYVQSGLIHVIVQRVGIGNVTALTITCTEAEVQDYWGWGAG